MKNLHGAALRMAVAVWAGAVAGCAPVSIVDADNDGASSSTDSSGLVLGAVSEAPPDGGAAAATTVSSSTPVAELLTFSGRLTNAGEHQVFDLGPGALGDSWEVETSGNIGSLVFVLFDADYTLLSRQRIVSGFPLRHALRAATNQLYLAVMPLANTAGGAFDVRAVRGSADIPAPRPQTVWLNFSGSAGIRVNGRSSVSFPAFRGDQIAATYTDDTAVIKQVIAEVMRSDYAPYHVTILTSDDTPSPSGEYTTVHFGGEAEGLLGLADSVDAYNQDLSEQAIVYVQSFAPYSTMNLSGEEMAVMLANVGSHELGHLLGLYHTQLPTDVMDTTGTALDLAGDQSLGRAPLEPTVFVVGYENAPAMLEAAVGRNAAAKEVTNPLAEARIRKAQSMRAFAGAELKGHCGTCNRLDDR